MIRFAFSVFFVLAATFPDDGQALNSQDCMAISRIGSEIAKWRDNGMSEENARNRIANAIASSPGVSVVVVGGVLAYVYDHPNQKPINIMTSVNRECSKSAN